jgi:hypothetical protein
LRLQHIDGTFEAVTPNWDPSGLEDTEIGTQFALSDGRWVQVIGLDLESDGSVQSVIVGEIFEPRVYGATGHEAYVHGSAEWAMGSYKYGSLILDGSQLDLAASVEVDSLLWSQDGRYLAASLFDPGVSWDSGTRTVGTKAAVIDADARLVVAKSEPQNGEISTVRFVGRSLLFVVPEVGSKYLAF